MYSLSLVPVSLYWHKRHRGGRQVPSRVSVLSLSLLILKVWGISTGLQLDHPPKLPWYFFLQVEIQVVLVSATLQVATCTLLQILPMLVEAVTPSRSDNQSKKKIILIFFHISVTLNTSCIYHYIIKVYFHHVHKPVCEVASLLEETFSNERERIEKGKTEIIQHKMVINYNKVCSICSK